MARREHGTHARYGLRIAVDSGSAGEGLSSADSAAGQGHEGVRVSGHGDGGVLSRPHASSSVPVDEVEADDLAVDGELIRLGQPGSGSALEARAQREDEPVRAKRAVFKL